MNAPSVRNVTRAYRLASDEDRRDGLAWYPTAHRIASELDTDYRRAAAVIAVLSPQTSWPMNVRLARLAYGQHAAGESLRLPCLTGSAAKARRILSGENPADVVSGPKVTAFAVLIADPTDRYAVCIDRHAIDVALGRVTDDATRGYWQGARNAAMADVYRRAATILRVTPAECQAVTWTYWRRNRAAANHGEVAA